MGTDVKVGDVAGAPPAERAGWRAVLACSEGKILLAGLGLGVLYLAGIGLTLRWSSDLFQKLLTMTGSHVVLGRAAGLTAGYSSGLPHWVIVAANMVIETVAVLVFYPLFVLSYRKLIVIGPLKDALDRAQRAAESQQGRILRYGVPMLLLFVWFPMYFTGPLVGCVIGFLIGLRPVVNLPVVLGGTYIAILCWGMLLQRINAALETLGPYPPLILVGVVVLIAVSLLVRRAVAAHNHHVRQKTGE
jgi:uncharacterized membrane protein